MACLIAPNEIDYTSSVAIYTQIAAAIRRKIEEGTLKPGDHLDTEMNICNALNVSRTTVRLAMNELEQDEYLVRRRGKGTFVTRPKVKRNLNDLYNFTGEISGLGMEPTSTLIEFSTIPAIPKVIQSLNLNEGELVYKIKRLRLADGTPMMLETAYIPVKFCPNISQSDLTDSLYAVISQYNNAFPLEAEETYDAILVKEKDAKYLGCPAGSPAFKINRISRNTKGQLFEYAILIAPGQINRYHIVLRKNDSSVIRHSIETENT